MLVGTGEIARMFELDLEEPGDFEYEDYEPLSCIDCGSEAVEWKSVMGYRER